MKLGFLHYFFAMYLQLIIFIAKNVTYISKGMMTYLIGDMNLQVLLHKQMALNVLRVASVTALKVSVKCDRAYLIFMRK